MQNQHKPHNQHQFSHFLLIFSIIFLYASFSAPTVRSQILDHFTRFFVVGDSYSAGFMHGTWYSEFEACEYPLLFYEQLQKRYPVNGTFTYPIIGYPGIPGLFIPIQWWPLPLFELLEGPGTVLNPDAPRPYRNLSVPGLDLDGIFQTPTHGPAWIYHIVLRGEDNVLAALQTGSPSILFLWVGINEVAPALALGFVWPGLTVTPVEEFRIKYRTLLHELERSVDNEIFVFTIPDITHTPRCHYLSPYAMDLETGILLTDENGDPFYWLGLPEETLPEEICVMEQAVPYIRDGYGLPENLGGNGQPLPGKVFLSPQEVLALRNHIQAYNDILQSESASRPQVYLVPAHEWFQEWEQGVRYGGIQISFEFPWGGFWGLDAFHPSPIAHALIANKLIQYMNRKFDLDIPQINLRQFLTGSKCAYPALSPPVGGHAHLSSMFPWEIEKVQHRLSLVYR